MKFYIIAFSIFVFNANILAQKSPVTIFIAGDSTCRDETPEKTSRNGLGRNASAVF